MPAVGITDSGNLFGALEISELLVNNGIQPIIGCEFSLILNNHRIKCNLLDIEDLHKMKMVIKIF